MLQQKLKQLLIYIFISENAAPKGMLARYFNKHIGINQSSSIEDFWKSQDDSEHIRNTQASASEIIPKESNKYRSAFMKDEENLDFSLAWDYQSYSDFHFGSWRLLCGLFDVRCND